MASAKLTTTSYAILGHLAMQPWSMYDLAAQMRRNVRFFYPRAESQVYEEPKRLVALGLATAKLERDGARPRTVYEITPSGRAELARWLAQTPAKGAELEFEGLLRVFLAPFGSGADLSRTLEAIRAANQPLRQTAAIVREEYLAGVAPFQRYASTRAMVHDFLFHFAELIDTWTERWLTEAPEDLELERPADTNAMATFRRNTASAGEGDTHRPLSGSAQPVRRRSDRGRT